MVRQKPRHLLAAGASAPFLFSVSLEVVGIPRSEMVELVVAGFEV